MVITSFVQFDRSSGRCPLHPSHDRLRILHQAQEETQGKFYFILTGYPGNKPDIRRINRISGE